MERVKGIEPSYAAWEATVLPLNYTRLFVSGEDICKTVLSSSELHNLTIITRHFRIKLFSNYESSNISLLSQGIQRIGGTGRRMLSEVRFCHIRIGTLNASDRLIIEAGSGYFSTFHQ